MMLTAAHRALLEDWHMQTLECRILCDQLYMNAMVREVT